MASNHGAVHDVDDDGGGDYDCEDDDMAIVMAMVIATGLMVIWLQSGGGRRWGLINIILKLLMKLICLFPHCSGFGAASRSPIRYDKHASQTILHDTQENSKAIPSKSTCSCCPLADLLLAAAAVPEALLLCMVCAGICNLPIARLAHLLIPRLDHLLIL